MKQLKYNRVMHLERTSSGRFREVRNPVVRSTQTKGQQEDNSMSELYDKVKGIMKTLNTSEVKLAGNMAKDYIKQFFQNDSMSQEEQYSEEEDEHKSQQETGSIDEDKSQQKIASKDVILIMLRHALDDPAVQEQIRHYIRKLGNDEERFNQLILIMSDILQKK